MYPGLTDTNTLNSADAEQNGDVEPAVNRGDGEIAVEGSGQVAIEGSKGVKLSISSQKLGNETLEMGQ